MSIQSRTLLKSITGDLMRVFRNNWTENCGKLSEKNMQWSSLLLQLHEYSLQPNGLHYRCTLRMLRVARIQSTAYRTALQMHSENAQNIKGVLKFRNFQKNLCERVPFSLTLQPCSLEFLTSANADSKKNVSFQYFEIVGSLPEKGLY